MINCNVCGCTNFSRLIYFKPDDIYVLKCKKCGLVFLNPIKLEKLINDDYEDLDQQNSFCYFMETRKTQYLKDLSIIRKYVPSGKLIDVGSSFGIFLNFAHNYFNVTGIEPSMITCKFSEMKFPKINVINTVFEKHDFKDDKYDVLTLWSVLEHTVNPSKVIIKTKEILNYNGLLCIRVPNFKGLIPKIIILIHRLSFGKIDSFSRSLYQMDFVYKHFYHFNIYNLTKLLNIHGFDVIYYYKENSLNEKYLKNRAEISAKKGDTTFLKNPLILLCVRAILKIVNFLGVQDEIVIFAKKLKV